MTHELSVITWVFWAPAKFVVEVAHDDLGCMRADVTQHNNVWR